jgi:hypothetical protein
MGIYSFDQEDGVATGGSTGVITVGTSAVEAKVGASALSARIYIALQAKDTGIFMGTSSAVTTSTGLEIFKDQTLLIPANSSIWLIASAASKTVRIIEFSSEQPT